MKGGKEMTDTSRAVLTFVLVAIIGAAVTTFIVAPAVAYVVEGL